MIEDRREQRPLLCESADEDDPLRWELDDDRRRRRAPSDRARHKLKGAATVFKQWPSYWTPSAYLWFIMGTLCLLFFVIYNNALAISHAPPLKLTKSVQASSQYDESAADESASPQVYMHVFTENYANVDLRTYEPHINVLTKQYKAFNFNLMILINDTLSSKYKDNSEQENNEQALNALLSSNDVNSKRATDVKNVNIRYGLLSNYLDNSPLGKEWRTFPKSFIPFLTRAVSIWDKGGIAFNPQILIPKPSTAVFVDKLHVVMKGYRKFNENKNEKRVQNKSGKEVATHKNKFNNIQDIIEALERNEQSNKSNEINLTGMETELSPFIYRKLMSFNKKFAGENDQDSYSNKIENAKSEKPYSLNTKKGNSSHTGVVGENFLIINSGKKAATNKTFTRFRDNNLFSGIFHKIFKEKSYEPNDERSKTINKNRRSRKSTISNFIPDRTPDIKKLYRPLVMSPGDKYVRKYYVPKDMNFEQDKLTIDLKGNIIATETPCHAFIGTLFSNTFHHYEDESVTDFIVAQLSYFCKGTLSACKGINLILI